MVISGPHVIEKISAVFLKKHPAKNFGISQKDVALLFRPEIGKQDIPEGGGDVLMIFPPTC